MVKFTIVDHIFEIPKGIDVKKFDGYGKEVQHDGRKYHLVAKIERESRSGAKVIERFAIPYYDYIEPEYPRITQKHLKDLRCTANRLVKRNIYIEAKRLFHCLYLNEYFPVTLSPSDLEPLNSDLATILKAVKDVNPENRQSFINCCLKCMVDCPPSKYNMLLVISALQKNKMLQDIERVEIILPFLALAKENVNNQSILDRLKEMPTEKLKAFCTLTTPLVAAQYEYFTDDRDVKRYRVPNQVDRMVDFLLDIEPEEIAKIVDYLHFMRPSTMTRNKRVLKPTLEYLKTFPLIEAKNLFDTCKKFVEDRDENNETLLQLLQTLGSYPKSERQNMINLFKEWNPWFRVTLTDFLNVLRKIKMDDREFILRYTRPCDKPYVGMRVDPEKQKKEFEKSINKNWLLAISCEVITK